MISLRVKNDTQNLNDKEKLMDRLQNIVIGVDFSEFSQVALAQAKRISRWNQSDLHLIHVVDVNVVAEFRKAIDRPLQEITEDVQKTTHERIGELFAEDPLERRKESVHSASEVSERRINDTRRIELKVDVIVGDPFNEISQRMRQVEGDLLVLGANGATDPKRGLGELATQCLRKAQYRIMIVRGTQAQPFRKVVACVSFSDCAPRVVEKALQIALLDKAELHVVHSFMPPWDVLHYKSPTAAAYPDFKIQYKENLLAKLKQYLKKHEQYLKDLPVECRLIECNKPADGIIDYVDNTTADLVVLGTRGRTSVKSRVLGTQAERIVHHVPASALILKPQDYES
jgi:nucleotide-binding universal stress UspA family protein